MAGRERAKRAEDGFTLIEALVALAILATSAVALLGATEAHIARIGGLETRALAQIAAENRLVEIELGLGAEPVEAPILDRRFVVAAETAETSDPDLVRIALTVTDAQTGAVALRDFSGFVRAEAVR